MSRVGISILAHRRFDRVGQLARSLAEQGCAVAVHVDRKAPDQEFEELRQALADLPDVVFPRRIACHWGHFSLVEAQIASAELLLARFPDLTHVCQISGACLPLKPMETLHAFLDDAPKRDYIVSESAFGTGWVKDGLKLERFTLYFPFLWRKNRRLFDLLVTLQRRAKIRRRIPEGLSPYIGSQWWCLTRRTLEKMLRDPNRKQIDRFFRRSWIPDESYFQTLARRHSEELESRSLTFVRFDYEGKPVVFYDDHLSALQDSGYFFARKIWPGADGLYGSLLQNQGTPPAQGSFNALNKHLDTVETKRRIGRHGLRMQSRHPHPSVEPAMTGPAPYSVFLGVAPLLTGFNDWTQKRLGLVVAHAGTSAGCLVETPELLKNEPYQFLQALIRNQKPRRIGWHLDLQNGSSLPSNIAADPSASVFFVQGGWLLELWKKHRTVSNDAVSSAALLELRERKFAESMKRVRNRSRITQIDLPAFLSNHHDFLQQIGQMHGQPAARDLPALLKTSGAAKFVSDLRAEGIPIDESWQFSLAALEAGEQLTSRKSAE